jgi:hypothetical protein
MNLDSIITPIDPTLKKTKYRKLTNKHKYVVIDTGYTARITKGVLKEKFFENVYGCLDDDDKKNIELLFIYDKLYGEGFYRFGSDNDEVNRLIECTKMLSIYNSGIACFKCDELFYKNLDRAINNNIYCTINGVINTEIYFSDQDDEPTIKYVLFDTLCG